jgi:hypothetical protein
MNFATSLILIPVLATTLWYLAGMAQLTRALWSRYPAWLDEWVRCPACFGTWAGAAVALVLDLPMGTAPGWTPAGLVLAGLWATFWVPLLANLHHRSLTYFHPPGDDDAQG